MVYKTKVISFFEKRQNWFYSAAVVLLFLLALARVFYVSFQKLLLNDFAGYCTVAFALFRGQNPFPDHLKYLTTPPFEDISVGGFPAQMLFFALPGFLWGKTVQILWIVLNILIIIFVTGLTLVKACGYRWEDLWRPGRKQFFFAVCCFLFLFSQNAMNTMRLGQIPVVLTFFLYGMFWLSPWPVLRTVYFALIAAMKYSVLPVFAPLLFFKGHWKLCIAAFSLFVLLCLSPVFFGNDLKEVYVGYIIAVKKAYQPGECGHYDTNGVTMCHIEFFKNSTINYLLKAVVIGCMVWMYWRERKTKFLSDTLLMLSLNLTMLLSYHQVHDMSLVFPLFFIRLFGFTREKNWSYFGIEVLFLLFLIVPGALVLKTAALLGDFCRADSFVYLTDQPWGKPYYHLFPITALWTMALAVWNLHLYLHVNNPYIFRFAESDHPPGQ